MEQNRLASLPKLTDLQVDFIYPKFLNYLGKSPRCGWHHDAVLAGGEKETKSRMGEKKG